MSSLYLAGLFTELVDQPKQPCKSFLPEGNGLFSPGTLFAHLQAFVKSKKLQLKQRKVRFSRQRLLGSGGQAVIHEGTVKVKGVTSRIIHKGRTKQESSTRQVAIKKMDVSRALSLIACTAEVMTLDQLQGCPYVLPLHGVLLSSHVVGGRKTRTAGLVMDKGVCTVSDRLRERTMPVSDVFDMLNCVTAVLVLMHHKNIVHKDIKAMNVMYAGDRRWVVVDFGAAASLADPGEVSRADTVTETYMPPELLRGLDTVGTPIDMYAFGALTLEALTGDTADVTNRAGEVLRLARGGSLDYESGAFEEARWPQQLPHELTDACKVLVYACLQADPSSRPTALSVLGQCMTIKDMYEHWAGAHPDLVEAMETQRRNYRPSLNAGENACAISFVRPPAVPSDASAVKPIPGPVSPDSVESHSLKSPSLKSPISHKESVISPSVKSPMSHKSHSVKSPMSHSEGVVSPRTLAAMLVMQEEAEHQAGAKPETGAPAIGVPTYQPQHQRAVSLTPATTQPTKTHSPAPQRRAEPIPKQTAASKTEDDGYCGFMASRRQLAGEPIDHDKRYRIITSNPYEQSNRSHERNETLPGGRDCSAMNSATNSRVEPRESAKRVTADVPSKPQPRLPQWLSACFRPCYSG